MRGIELVFVVFDLGFAAFELELFLIRGNTRKLQLLLRGGQFLFGRDDVRLTRADLFGSALYTLAQVR